MISKTLGGDRLGSGNKMKVQMHNYNRSTFNLSQKFTSTIAPGVLYPFLVEPCQRLDTFNIDLEAACRTIPTMGPLFGSFKMQLDVFLCPMRLYQGILHNNPTGIGLKMKDVKLPKIKISANGKKGDSNIGKVADNHILKYLGFSGLGVHSGTGANNIQRDIMAIPLLAYYDIFKNYYSNKQEEYAYFLKQGYKEQNIKINETYEDFPPGELTSNVNNINIDYENKSIYSCGINYINKGTTMFEFWNEKTSEQLTTDKIIFYVIDNEMNYKVANAEQLKEYMEYRYQSVNLEINAFNIKITSTEQISDSGMFYIQGYINTTNTTTILERFKLKEIDDLRYELLSNNVLGETYYLNEFADDKTETALMYYLTQTNNIKDELGGLVVKTYQSDIFNNWINTEYIDGENGIAEITAISTANGNIKVDEINIAEKLYNMLNRVAASGNTYEDWQDVVYGTIKRRQIESPIYCGGMSNEIIFEEIIQTSPADGDPLGTLGGRGISVKRKGGHIEIKAEEAGFVIGILSITPRINYTQGNAWYLTELNSIDDMHKPALDGIGYQNLIGEQLFWKDTALTTSAPTPTHRSIIGKLPAWINYMSAVDKAYGDFAKGNEKAFMVLQRDYEYDENAKMLKDTTTYIDPEKYNYAFAYRERNAQNFWIQINSKITKRSLMSAKQIPNL